MLIYLGLGSLLALFQRKLIYYPDRVASVAAVSLPGAEIEPVSLTASDGLRLAGWLLSCRSERDATPVQDSDRPVVIYFCGNAGHRGWRSSEFSIFTGMGANVLCFDYRGYGENPGTPGEEALAQDALTVWRFATEDRKIDPRRIVLFGESLGGGVAVRLAAELSAAGTPPAGLIVRSTFSSLVDTGGYHFPWLPVQVLMIDRFDSCSHIPQVTCPILILHGRKDTIVPYEFGEKLFAAACGESRSGIPKRMIELARADHNDVLDCEFPAYCKGLRDFLSESCAIAQDAAADGM